MHFVVGTCNWQQYPLALGFAQIWTKLYAKKRQFPLLHSYLFSWKLNSLWTATTASLLYLPCSLSGLWDSTNRWHPRMTTLKTTPPQTPPTKAYFLIGMKCQIPGLEVLLSAAAVKNNHFLPGWLLVYFYEFFRSLHRISLYT